MTGGPMDEQLQPKVVRAQQRLRQAALQTDGVFREQAFSTDDAWVGIVTTEPGEMSAWHHHGDHDTYAYVVSGLKRSSTGWVVLNHSSQDQTISFISPGD